jgi:hypothetical protein
MTRSSAARLAAHESWARTPDRAARTSAARAGLLAKFEAEARERLGPEAGEAAIAAAAESARKAHYARISRAGVAARKAS